MDNRTREAKAWLDRRYSQNRDGKYFAHEPIFGLDSDSSEPNQIMRLARIYHQIQLFESLEFQSVLDVGGGEGYVAALLRDLYSVVAHNSDLSAKAGEQARKYFGIQHIASDASRLPFKDCTYDLVLCSEVIEHLTNPVAAISELVRVSAKYVVITTAEFCPLGEIERILRLLTLDDTYPHAERNWFTVRDFQTLLGSRLGMYSQIDNFHGEAYNYFLDRKLSREQAEIALEILTCTSSLDPNHSGIIVILQKTGDGGSSFHSELHPMGENRKQQVFDLLLNAYHAPEAVDDHTVDVGLIDKLMCPTCGGSIRLDGDTLICLSCDTAYLVQNRVPVMFPNPMDSPVAQDARKEELIAQLAQADPKRAEKIARLMAKMQGKRPLTSNPLLSRISQPGLRLLWFLRRPGSVMDKTRWVIQRLKKEPLPEHKALEEALS